MLKDPHALVVLDGTKVIAFSQYEKTNYERVFIPRSVTKIENSAFSKCKSLKEVVFEEGSKLEEIEGYCFRSSGLEEITLPKALKNVSIEAFKNCGNLRTIYVEDGCEADLLLVKVPDST